jgi:hypothetical protein
MQEKIGIKKCDGVAIVETKRKQGIYRELFFQFLWKVNKTET